ncbi:hypothetical protein BFW01_g4051 [Lasiodiplodia theobromae]|nr:hypothetical protein BFW01_g4051 [Lasiodiplodia theobromae]
MADDWKAQKENIKRLYMDEDLTCKQLAVQMKELYGFERKYADSASEIYGALTDLTRPSVKEYQRHFSLWNFRKSLKQKEWRFVGRRIAKRKAEEGKESELIVNGYHFPQRKIRKALSRNFETTYENFQRQSVIRRSHTPDGIMITTPPRQRSPAACVYRRNLATIDGLPCLSFMHVMQQYVPLFEQLANSLFCAVQDPLEISLVLRGSGTSKFTQSSGLAALVTVSSSNSCLMETFKNVAPEHLNNFMAVVVELSNFRGKHMELEKMFGRTVMALTASVQLQNRRSQILDLMAEHDPVVESLVEVLFKNALHENQVSLVQLLLKHTRVGPNDSLGNDTPLDIAAESGSLAMTLTLLDAGAHLQHLKYGTKYWIKLLYKKFTRLEFQSFLHKYPLDEPSAIPAMLEIGDVELIDFFLERAIQKEFLPNSSVELALHWAIELKKMRLVDRIISSGFEFTPWGMFAAIYDNALHFVVMALERGMDANYVDGSGYSFLYTAISKDNIPIATVLLQFGANVDRPLPRTDHTYLLIKAVCEGLEDMVRLLLKKGADVHVRHSNGMSPLAYAILNGNYGIATYLVNWGAGLERPANQLIPTPLQIAAWNGDQHMVELLLERNADVNACPPNFEWRDIGRQTEPMNGRTALVNAIGGHSSEPLALVKLLISAGADVNEMQGTTSSALYTALQMREESVLCDQDRQP